MPSAIVARALVGAVLRLDLVAGLVLGAVPEVWRGDAVGAVEGMVGRAEVEGVVAGAVVVDLRGIGIWSLGFWGTCSRDAASGLSLGG